MSLTEFLPWINLLLVPTCSMVFTINSRLARIEEIQKHHSARLEKLDGIKA